MRSEKRKLDMCVISDTHLGTYGCQAKELLVYLKSIKTDTLILNGDIIDIWNFKKSYFPNSHFEVIRYLMKMMQKGTNVIYIPGNHDELLRNYTDFSNGNLKIVDHYNFVLNKKRYWVFHGDVFDHTTKGMAKFIARIGGKGYDWLIIMNRFINRILESFGREKVSLSKRVKMRVKKAVKWIQDFEQTAIELAIADQYDVVICGHIHQPKMKEVATEEGKVLYLNAGDWVENLTALEYYNHQWHVYQHLPKQHNLSPKRKVKSKISQLILTKTNFSFFS